jgi:maltooligosyltrehalose trehalohydrolase
MNIYPETGAFIDSQGIATFRVWAPFRKAVTLQLPDQLLELDPLPNGYWEVKVAGVYPGTLYYYQLDGELQRPDPASRWQPEGVHGPSAIPATRFSFTDDRWTGLEPAAMIIYEIHTGTFSPEGTFQGIIQRLPALKELGITAIELMPVAQFAGDRNWGYDGVYPFAVQHSYGSTDDLKMLVDIAHQLDIAVILDVVYNHQGPEGNYLQDYGPYFTDKYKTPWGSAINFDGPWCDGVRGFYLQNALMWLDEFHIDGLRLDAVHAFSDSSALHFTAELSAAVKELEVRTGKRKVLIGEIDLNDPRYVNPPAAGGYGLDAQWVDEFHHALHSSLTGERKGYYEDFGELSHLVRSFEDVYVYTGQYSVHRKRRFGVAPANNPFSQFVVFAQNHDQVGNRMLGERLSVLLPFEARKLAAAAVILSPFIPLLFMGEEYGEEHPFLFFTSHTDPALISAVQEGRQREFAHFYGGGTVPDPQAPATFEQSKLSWQITGSNNVALLACYRTLLAFRKSRQAMQNPDRTGSRIHHAGNNKLLVLERSMDNDAVLIVLNFSESCEAVPCTSSGRLRKIFDSASIQFNGPGTLPAEEEGNILVVQPLSAVVYEINTYEN